MKNTGKLNAIDLPLVRKHPTRVKKRHLFISTSVCKKDAGDYLLAIGTPV